METSIIVAIISGIVTLAATVISVVATNAKTRQQMAVSQAVMQEQIRALTEEVRRHNNFAQRMPVVEEQIKVANHRIEDLEARK